MPGAHRYSLGQLLLGTTLVASLIGAATALIDPPPNEFSLLGAALLAMVALGLLTVFLRSWERSLWWYALYAEGVAVGVRKAGPVPTPAMSLEEASTRMTQEHGGVLGATTVGIAALVAWLLLIIVVRSRPLRNPKLPPPPRRSTGRQVMTTLITILLISMQMMSAMSCLIDWANRDDRLRPSGATQSSPAPP